MAERPILFSAPMVRAILADTKTQTRRVAPIADLDIKPHSSETVTWGVRFSKTVKGVLASHSGGRFSEDQARRIIASQFNPYGIPGDRLWVRETWLHFDRTPIVENGTKIVGHLPGGYAYRADMDDCEQVPVTENGETVWRTPKEPWRPSIHMPRHASRITLEITGVRAERLHDISEADAIVEGLAVRRGKQAFNIRGDAEYGLREWRYDDTRWNVSAAQAYRALWEQINGAGSWAANPWVWVVEFKRIGAALAERGEQE